jgi:hypothetical protein
MDNISRYDPFKELACLDPFLDMDDMFSRFMMRPVLRGGVNLEPQIKLDIK